MQCTGQYVGVSDMQQELMLAAGGATHHMFSAHQDVAHQHQHHHHHQHQHYHQSLQQQQAAHEMLMYHRQASLQQEPQDGLHLSPPELHGTHILFGLHHHVQQKALPIAHQMSLGSESSEILALSSLAAPRSASTTTHDHVPQYKPMLASCIDQVSTMDSTAVDDFADLGTDDTDKGSLMSGSRWPRQETLAFLRIRSDMDALFRDSALKGPLWDEVSRKLYEAGYQRSAKKCKEKFENVHKYYKKTKDGKCEKQDGKTYRFCTELEAIYAANQEHDMEMGGGTTMAVLGEDGSGMFPGVAASGDPSMQRLEEDAPSQMPGQDISTGPNSSSSTSCGNEVMLAAAQAGVYATEQQICGKKRKRSSWRSMRAFFEDLAKQLMERQDALHKKFLEAIERREDERVRREEAYKRQEMARTSREQDLRAREQALASTRDAALVAFLHKVTGETLQLPEMTPRVIDAAGCTMGEATAATTPSGEDPLDMKEGGLDANSRRWPKVEVQALIRVRTSLEPRFQEAGPKAQLWEEVSSSMSCLGFSRSGKRCKEKWENINKYYRKTKDNVGRKLRPESATKTCPYFHQLEVLYEHGILASPNSSSGVNKSVSKLDGPQTSGEFLESTSKDDSQQTHEVSGNPHYQQAGGSVSDVRTSGNAQATDDVRDIVARCPTTTCSSTGATNPLCNGINAHDISTRFDFRNTKTEPGMIDSDPINVNCHPPRHFSDRLHEQAQGQLPHEDRMSSKVSAGMMVNEGTHFVSEMMEIQQHHHQQRFVAEHLYERHQLVAQHHEHAVRVEMQESDEGKDIEMRMQQQEEMSRLDQERSHHDSATLMALVHKLAAGGGHPSEFDLSASPASPE